MMRALGRVSTVVTRPGGAVMQSSGSTGRPAGRNTERAYKFSSDEGAFV